MDEYEERAAATAATRLAYLLHSAGVLTDTGLADFLYPSEEAMEQAEGRQMP